MQQARLATSIQLGLMIALSSLVPDLRAQGGRGTPVRTAKSVAPVDLVGQWMAVINEDWRYRMMTPAKSDVAGVPLNPAGRKLADSWNPANDEAAGEQCRSYGAPGLLRHPLRIRIAWADDDTLKLESDAGMQTRLFSFKEPKGAAGDLQGVSQPSWDIPAQAGGRGRGGAPPTGGSLMVTTTKMKSGYLRKNGVPYSDKAVLTEYYDRTNEPDGESWLVVTSIVDDPLYLTQPFVVSTHFKRQTDQSGWEIR